MAIVKPLILITNDDGVSAPGLRALIAVMAEIGEIIVVAPDKPQSGMGHAITTNNTLYLNKISKEDDVIMEYSCSGTPVDCVKLAVNEILKRKPDLCVSGVNHGSNSSINVIYSGTMSAAVEAGIEGIPAIGFSLLDYDWNADFETMKPFIRKITLEVLENNLPQGVVLNVNFPKLKKENIKGIKICRQAKALWVEKFDKRQTPQGRDYYWLAGE
ncbi:MAG TPA: 5'/3'-nucleotidase SurE, partial [Flavobacterium sp.]|uniref:5'/3'-nucleotidase SurE n=1 Tax=Flavobacterium sp. TaxID=239 RepID=UPI002F3FF95D